MAGKSLRGRDGKLGGKQQSASGRSSSTSSNPTVSSSRESVSLRPLPVQYNFTPNFIPAMQSLEVPISPRPPPSPVIPPPPPPPVIPSPPPPRDDYADDAPPPQNHQQPPMTLDDLLRIPGRENYCTVLSPTPMENTTWFGRDKGKLTRRISKIMKDKFDGPYYSYTIVDSDIQRRFFTAFAHTHTWYPFISDTVREEFDIVCTLRLKGMISVARTNRKRPRWIKETLWKTMVDYWNTEDAMERSKNASIARNSPRGDFGPPKHLSGQKSYLQIQQEMEDELGRPVTIEEVFIKTHTRADGTYVDLKANHIGEAYKKNLEEKLVEVDPYETSDGTSQRLPLTPDEMNEIFIQSTIPDERGRPYGLGSLHRIHSNEKRKEVPGCSTSVFLAIQEQLQAAQRQIEEKAADNARCAAELAAELARRDAESARLAAGQQNRINSLEMVISYLKSTNSSFSTYMASNAPSTTIATTTTTTTPEAAPTTITATTTSSPT